MSVQMKLALCGILSSLMALICARLPASHAPGGLSHCRGGRDPLDFGVDGWVLGYRVQGSGLRV